MKEKAIWICNHCGREESKWAGNCIKCQQWNTFEQQVVRSSRFGGIAGAKAAAPTPICQIESQKLKRIKTGFVDIDRMMGEGTVAGGLTLIGGEPGIGKSTLLLQLSASFAGQGLVVLYVCGEESLEQTALRAKRLGIDSPNVYLFSETLFSSIKQHVGLLRPDVLIIDSVQIVYKEEIPSLPGSVTQVREVAMECMHLAKRQGITTFLIGHVTKTGDLAGPRILEHMVDTVFEFEGDSQQGFRLLRSIKNRFGPTDEFALFQMNERGLTEIPNPSEVFLQERIANAVGSVIIPTLEGTRPVLVEVQALVAPSSYPTPSRRCTGLDQKRLALLLAVLEKRMGYKLHTLDVFVSVVGGVKIVEPAIDLGILVSIASSYRNCPVPNETVVMGEVGLGGEVRSVPRPESRLKEALQMGFNRCILSQRQLKRLTSKLPIKLEGVQHVDTAINRLLS